MRGLDANGVDERSDRPVGKRGYAGVAALVLLAGAGVFFNQAYAMATKAISCIFSNPSAVSDNMGTGSILTCFGFLTLILALAFAGASVAQGQQTILGGLVIGITMLPFLLFLASIFFGFSLDFSALAGSSDMVSMTNAGPISPAKHC